MNSAVHLSSDLSSDSTLGPSGVSGICGPKLECQDATGQDPVSPNHLQVNSQPSNCVYETGGMVEVMGCQAEADQSSTVQDQSGSSVVQPVQSQSKSIPGVGEDEEDLEGEELEEEARPVKSSRDPRCPSQAKRDEHEPTHMPYRSWCPECVAGRKPNLPHPDW